MAYKEVITITSLCVMKLLLCVSRNYFFFGVVNITRSCRQGPYCLINQHLPASAITFLFVPLFRLFYII